MKVFQEVVPLPVLLQARRASYARLTTRGQPRCGSHRRSASNSKGDSSAYHSEPGQLALIEPSLQPSSRKFGNIRNSGRRLSTSWRHRPPNRESRDGSPLHKSPRIAGISRLIGRNLRPRDWLAGVRGFELAHSRSNPVSAFVFLSLGIARAIALVKC